MSGERDSMHRLDDSEQRSKQFFLGLDHFNNNLNGYS